MSLFSLGILIPTGTDNIFNKPLGKLPELLNSLRVPCLFHSFIRASNKYVLDTYYIPGTVLGTGMWQWTKHKKIPALRGLTS